MAAFSKIALLKRICSSMWIGNQLGNSVRFHTHFWLFSSHLLNEYNVIKCANEGCRKLLVKFCVMEC